MKSSYGLNVLLGHQAVARLMDITASTWAPLFSPADAMWFDDSAVVKGFRF